ncbi:hypothetical protein PHLCEN_2v2386 [Hermanssonia centrifuga]|uniref:Uncharacterized protein n=1 Tax=Hermanssonia centrifuga TaxID=98765 RepID=A0A2R6RLZ9_9APHY|nr:hypothetical protein PHLCEN_2v2386 [Hermanssonia centrifuga]
MFLTDTSTSKGKAKPQARTAPRPLAARPSQQTILTENSSAAATPAATPTLPTPSIARKYPALTATEIIRLLAGSVTSIHADPSAAVRTLQLRFYILSAFGGLQEQLPSEERDSEWEKGIHNGELTKAIDDAFHPPAGAPREDQAWAKDLKAVLTAMGWHH